MTSTDALAGTAAGWAAVLVGGYLAVGLLGAALAHRADPLGCAADRLLLAYPPFARAALRAAVVASVGLGAAPGTSALAAEVQGAGRPRPPVVAPAHPAAEPLDWPVSSQPRPVRTHHDETVIVRPGECLWSLAARSVGRQATPAEVAAAWPRWWAANRDLIGSDPDVVHPGQRLRVPALIERSAS